MPNVSKKSDATLVLEPLEKACFPLRICPSRASVGARGADLPVPRVPTSHAAVPGLEG